MDTELRNPHNPSLVYIVGWVLKVSTGGQNLGLASGDPTLLYAESEYIKLRSGFFCIHCSGAVGHVVYCCVVKAETSGSFIALRRPLSPYQLHQRVRPPGAETSVRFTATVAVGCPEKP